MVIIANCKKRRSGTYGRREHRQSWLLSGVLLRVIDDVERGLCGGIAVARVVRWLYG